MQAETKEAPDGFGPIKFGMTKEEAWAAIDGKGKWRGNGDQDFPRLQYDIELPVGLPRPYRFVVYVQFRQSKVSGIEIVYNDEQRLNYICQRMASFLVRATEHIYGVKPLKSEVRDKITDKADIVFLYLFFFTDGSTITVTSFMDEDSRFCGFSMNYNKSLGVSLPY